MKMASQDKEKTRRGNPNYLGEWERIPKENFLLSLSKELSSKGRHKQHFSNAEKETEEELLDTLTALVKGINNKIDQLVGVPNGGNDPLLEERYQSADRLLAMAYDHYVKVRPEYSCDSSRERLLISVTGPHPGLLYDKEVVSEPVGEPIATSTKPARRGLTASVSPN